MKNKSIVVISLLSVINIGLIAFWILPTYNKAQNEKKAVFDERVLLERQRLQNTDIVSLTKQYQDIQDNVAELNKAFLKKENSAIFSLIETIETISKKNKVVEKVNIFPTPQSNADPIESSNIEITLSGSYDALHTSLSELESLPIYLSITSIDIGSPTSGTEKTGLQLTLKGTLNWI